MAAAVPNPPFALIDLQVNGGWGVDFTSPDTTLSDMRACCDAVFASGTAAFLPTLVSSPFSTYQRNLPMLARLASEPAMGGRLLGVHLEGPFLPADPRVLGAHRAENVSGNGVADLVQLTELSGGHLKLLTVAAELPGAAEIIAFAVRRGVSVAVGHSFFTSHDLRRVHRAGARAITHLGNALPSVLDKRDNPFYAGLLEDSLSACFIADGHHLSQQMLALLFRCKSPDRLIAVSDAAPVAGLPPGLYQTLGQTARLEPNGRLINEEEQHLVGSTATLLDCMNHLLSTGLCPPEQCPQVGGSNALALLGLDPSQLPTGPRVRYEPTVRRLVPVKG